MKFHVELGLIRLCFADLRDLSNGYLETKVDCAPGMKDVRLKDFLFIQTTDPDEVVFNIITHLGYYFKYTQSKTKIK